MVRLVLSNVNRASQVWEIAAVVRRISINSVQITFIYHFWFDGYKTTNEDVYYLMARAEPAKSYDEREKRLSSRPEGSVMAVQFTFLRCFEIKVDLIRLLKRRGCTDICPIHHTCWHKRGLSLVDLS